MVTFGPFRNNVKLRLIDSILSTSKGIDVEWLTEDISVEIDDDRVVELTMEVTVDTELILEVSFDSGANWTQLNSAVAVPIDELFTLTVIAKNGDLINFRSGTASTVDRFVVCFTP